MTTMLLMLFHVSISYFSNFPVENDCPDMTIEKVIENSDSGKTSIKIDVKGGISPYRFMFYDEEGRHITKGFEYLNNKVEGIAPGIYYSVVYDSNGCSIKTKIEVR